MKSKLALLFLFLMSCAYAEDIPQASDYEHSQSTVLKRVLLCQTYDNGFSTSGLQAGYSTYTDSINYFWNPLNVYEWVSSDSIYYRGCIIQENTASTVTTHDYRTYTWKNSAMQFGHKHSLPVIIYDLDDVSTNPRGDGMVKLTYESYYRYQNNNYPYLPELIAYKVKWYIVTNQTVVNNLVNQTNHIETWNAIINSSGANMTELFTFNLSTGIDNGVVANYYTVPAQYMANLYLVIIGIPEILVDHTLANYENTYVNNYSTSKSLTTTWTPGFLGWDEAADDTGDDDDGDDDTGDDGDDDTGDDDDGDDDTGDDDDGDDDTGDDDDGDDDTGDDDDGDDDTGDDDDGDDDTGDDDTGDDDDGDDDIGDDDDGDDNALLAEILEVEKQIRDTITDESEITDDQMKSISENAFSKNFNPDDYLPSDEDKANIGEETSKVATALKSIIAPNLEDFENVSELSATFNIKYPKGVNPTSLEFTYATVTIPVKPEDWENETMKTLMCEIRDWLYLTQSAIFIVIFLIALFRLVPKAVEA